VDKGKEGWGEGRGRGRERIKWLQLYWGPAHTAPYITIINPLLSVCQSNICEFCTVFFLHRKINGAAI